MMLQRQYSFQVGGVTFNYIPSLRRLQAYGAADDPETGEFDRFHTFVDHLDGLSFDTQAAVREYAAQWLEEEDLETEIDELMRSQ